MKRTPLTRKTPMRQRRAAGPDIEREPQARAVVATLKPLRRGTYAGGTSGQPVVKDEPARCEPYRRLVALLPCEFCGVVGFSQAAHPNTGKGMGLKADDRRCFPMCAHRPGVQGCHALLDQGALLTKEKRRVFEEAAGQRTRDAIEAAGMWPANLPKLKELKEQE